MTVTNEFNKYFTSIGQNTIHKIQSLANECNYDLAQSSFVPKCYPSSQQFTFRPVERTEINSMPTGKAPGNDKIPLRAIKDCLPAILPTLTSIVSNSLTSGIFPSIWKTVDEHVSSWTISEEEIKETEMSQRGQNQNLIWFAKRKSVLTASNFGKAAKTKVEPSNKLKAMIYSKFTTEAVQYRIESEEKAVQLYLREMQQQGFNLKVDEVGLLLSREKPYLGASLDRIVTNMDTNEKWGMEIKSPFSKAGMAVDKACQSKTFFLEKMSDETIRLKRNHDYYIQVQCQLYSSNLDLNGIIFVVYFGENKPLLIQNTPFDINCWHTHLPKIDYFFERAFFPEMLTRRF